MVAIDHNNEAVAEVLYAAAASDGTLDLEMLMLASSKGMKGIVEKLLAAGAKAETTDEVHGRRGWWAGDVW